MPATYSTIATTTVGSGGTASVTFNSFSGYTDLVIIINGGTATGGQSIFAQFNGDTGSNYCDVLIAGTGAGGSNNYTSQANSLTGARLLGRSIGTDSTLIGSSITHLMNYSNSTTFKSLINRTNLGGGVVSLVAMWRNTNAITSMVLTGEGPSNIIAGTTITLYGILVA